MGGEVNYVKDITKIMFSFDKIDYFKMYSSGYGAIFCFEFCCQVISAYLRFELISRLLVVP